MELLLVVIETNKICAGNANGKGREFGVNPLKALTNSVMYLK